MYTLLLLLAKVGIKPAGLRHKVRQNFLNHERGHHNLAMHHRRLARKARTSDCEANHSKAAREHATKAIELWQKARNMQ